MHPQNSIGFIFGCIAFIRYYLDYKFNWIDVSSFCIAIIMFVRWSF